MQNVISIALQLVMSINFQKLPTTFNKILSALSVLVASFIASLISLSKVFRVNEKAELPFATNYTSIILIE